MAELAKEGGTGERSLSCTPSSAATPRRACMDMGGTAETIAIVGHCEERGSPLGKIHHPEEGVCQRGDRVTGGFSMSTGSCWRVRPGLGDQSGVTSGHLLAAWKQGLVPWTLPSEQDASCWHFSSANTLAHPLTGFCLTERREQLFLWQEEEGCGSEGPVAPALSPAPPIPQHFPGPPSCPAPGLCSACRLTRFL